MFQSKNLPADITSYDLLKFFAVVIMVIDHVGFYFFPEDLWWRAVGRIGFPIWFFLVGHASGRDIPMMLWGGAVVLTAASVVVGMPLFPLNALVTIMLLRLLIDPVMAQAGRGRGPLFGTGALLALLALPTLFFCEYGTQALLFAMFGYMVRHRERLGFDAETVGGFAVLAIGTFLYMQYLTFSGFSQPQVAFMAVGTTAVSAVLLFFRPARYDILRGAAASPLKGLIQLCGRRTLEIYVGHLLLFKLMGLALGIGGLQLFHLKLL